MAQITLFAHGGGLRSLNPVVFFSSSCVREKHHVMTTFATREDFVCEWMRIVGLLGPTGTNPIHACRQKHHAFGLFLHCGESCDCAGADIDKLFCLRMGGSAPPSNPPALFK